MWSLPGRTPAPFPRSRLGRRALLAALLAVLLPPAASCAEGTLFGPAPPSPPRTPAAPFLPPDLGPPTLAGPEVRYQRVSPGYPDTYVLSLGADRAFVIVSADGSVSGAWSGRYARADSVLVFHYNASRVAGEYAAHGTLRGDTLLLRYNFAMNMTDFEDGVYVRVPGTP